MPEVSVECGRSWRGFPSRAGGGGHGSRLSGRRFRSSAPEVLSLWTASLSRQLRLIVTREGRSIWSTAWTWRSTCDGVVPSEMGPKRFDAIEGFEGPGARRGPMLTRTGAFETEATTSAGPKVPGVWRGVGRDPLSTAAVDGSAGLVLASGVSSPDALFVSTAEASREKWRTSFPAGRCLTWSRSSAGSCRPKSWP